MIDVKTIENKIINADCLDILKQLPDKCIDLVVTDPPYGIEYKAFRSGRGNILNDDNLNWVDIFCKETSRVLKSGNHLYCFVDVEYCPEFIFGFRKNGFKIRNLLTIPRGVKGNGGDRIFQQQFEFCIFATLGTKDEGRKFNETKILKPSEGYLKDKRYNPKEYLYRLPDNWYWLKASEHNSKNVLHPTQKSVESIQTMLKISSNENDLVLDCFSGSGTTAIACHNLKRRFICIEKDKDYYEASVKRLEDAQKQLTLF
jgi:DNA modification methylase